MLAHNRTTPPHERLLIHANKQASRQLDVEPHATFPLAQLQQRSGAAPPAPKHLEAGPPCPIHPHLPPMHMSLAVTLAIQRRRIHALPCAAPMHIGNKYNTDTHKGLIPIRAHLPPSTAHAPCLLFVRAPHAAWAKTTPPHAVHTSRASALPNTHQLAATVAVPLLRPQQLRQAEPHY